MIWECGALESQASSTGHQVTWTSCDQEHLLWLLWTSASHLSLGQNQLQRREERVQWDEARERLARAWLAEGARRSAGH